MKKALIRIGALTLAVGVLAGLAPDLLRSRASTQTAPTGVGLIRGLIKDWVGPGAATSPR